MPDQNGFWAEIFTTGTHEDSLGTKMTFSTLDLDMIISAFNETKELHKPPVRLGTHNEAGIAGGWVTGLRRDGEALMAYFSDMPSVVREAIEKKLYRNVSAGLRFSRKMGDKVWLRFLDHVAVLGERLPAIKSLKDIQTYLTNEDDGEDVRVFTSIFGEKEEEEMPDPKTDQGAIDVLTKQLEGLQAQFNEKMTAKDAENKALKEKADKLETENKRTKLESEAASHKASMSGIATFCEQQVKDRKMTPAGRDALMKDLETKAHFAEEDVMIPWANVKEFAETVTAKLVKGEKGGKENGKDGEKPPSKKLVERSMEYAEKHGVAFTVASQRILELDPDLAEAYGKELKGVE